MPDDPLASLSDLFVAPSAKIGPPTRRPDTESALNLISKYESGDRNVPNYRFDPGHTAQGHYQITDTNWRNLGPQLGIDLKQYPSAMAAPKEVQARVAEHMYNRRGFADWAPFNPRLRAAVQRGETGQQQAPSPLASISDLMTGPTTQAPQKPVSPDIAEMSALVTPPAAPAQPQAPGPETQPATTVAQPAAPANLSISDAAWHLGMTPQEAQRLSRRARRVLAEAVAEDQRKKAAGIPIQPPPLEYQNQMRAKAGLKPLEFNVATGPGGVSPYYQPSAGQVPDNRTIAVAPKPFTFGQPNHDAEYRAKLIQAETKKRESELNSGVIDPQRESGYFTKEAVERHVDEQLKSEAQQATDAHSRIGQITQEALDAIGDESFAGVSIGNVGRAVVSDVSALARHAANPITRMAPGDPIGTATRQLEAGAAEQARRTAPQTTFGQIKRGLEEGTGRLGVLTAELAAGGEFLRATELPEALNLPLQSAISASDQGPGGIVEGFGKGLLYHYGGALTGPYISKVGNGLLWVGAPAAEAHFLGGQPWSQAIAENLPMGVQAAVGGSRVMIRDGQGGERPARMRDIRRIQRDPSIIVPPVQVKINHNEKPIDLSQVGQGEGQYGLGEEVGRPLVPERKGTIAAQMEAMTSRRGNRLAVVIPEGQKAPTKIPRGYTVTRTEAGLVVHPKEIVPADIQKIVSEGDTWQLLGHANPDTPGPKKAVVAYAGRDALGVKSGDELMTSYVDPGNESAAIEEMRQQFQPYRPNIEVGGEETAAKAVNGRERRGPERMPEADWLTLTPEEHQQIRERLEAEHGPPTHENGRPIETPRAAAPPPTEVHEPVAGAAPERPVVVEAQPDKFTALSNRDLETYIENAQKQGERRLARMEARPKKGTPAEVRQALPGRIRRQRARLEARVTEAQAELERRRAGTDKAPSFNEWLRTEAGGRAGGIDPSTLSAEERASLQTRYDEQFYGRPHHSRFQARRQGRFREGKVKLPTPPEIAAELAQTPETLGETKASQPAPWEEAPKGQLFATSSAAQAVEPTADEAQAAKEPVVPIKAIENQNALRSYLGNKTTMARAGAFDIIPESWKNKWKRVVDVFGGSGLHGWQIGKALGKPVHYNELNPDVHAFQELASTSDGQEKIKRAWNPVADQIAALRFKHPQGGTEAAREVDQWWADTQKRLKSGTPEERATRVLLENTLGSMQNEQALLNTDKTWKKEITALGDVSNLLDRHRLNAQMWEAKTNKSAEELLPTAKAGDLVVLDPPYAKTTGYEVGNEHLTVNGAVNFIEQSVKPAIERGASILYTNSAHLPIVEALRQAGMEVRIERVRTQNFTKKEGGNWRYEVVGWTKDVSPPRGTDPEVLKGLITQNSGKQQDLSGKTDADLWSAYIRAAKEGERAQAAEPYKIGAPVRRKPAEQVRRDLTVEREKLINDASKTLSTEHFSVRGDPVAAERVLGRQIDAANNLRREFLRRVEGDERKALEKEFPEFSVENIRGDLKDIGPTEPQPVQTQARAQGYVPSEGEAVSWQEGEKTRTGKVERIMPSGRVKVRVSGRAEQRRITLPQETEFQPHTVEAKTVSHVVGRPKLDPTTDSLERAIRAGGGIRDDGSGELAQLKASGKAGLVTKDGKAPEEMAQWLREHGYGEGIFANTEHGKGIDAAAMIDAAIADASGSKRHYSSEREIDTDAAEKAHYQAQAEAEGYTLDANGDLHDAEGNVLFKRRKEELQEMGYIPIVRRQDVRGEPRGIHRSGSLFFGPYKIERVKWGKGEISMLGYLDYGPQLSTRVIDKTAKIYEGNSSMQLLEKMDLWDKPDPIAIEHTDGKFKSLAEIEDSPDPDFEHPNALYTVSQGIAARELTKQGYDGAHWLGEDDLSPEQYQIWNRNVIKRAGEVLTRKQQRELFARRKSEPAEGKLVTRDDTRLTINEHARDLLEKAKVLLPGTEGGAFTRAHAEILADKLRQQAKNEPADAPAYRKLARQISIAVNTEGEGRIAIAVPAAMQHEEFHVAADAGHLRDKHGDFDSLANHKAYLTAKTKLIAAGYPGVAQVLVEETAAHIAEGKHAEIGLTSEQAASFMNAWFRSFTEKNGTVSLAKFRRLENEAQQALETAYANAGTAKASQQPNGRDVRGLQEGPGARSPEADRGTRTRAFRRWFGQSKVVDAKGEPLVVYHQTPVAGFSEFRPWSHFGTAEAANNVWKNWKKDVHEGEPYLATYPVHLSIKNPLRMEDLYAVSPEDWAWNAAQQLKAAGVETPQYPTPERMIPALHAAGYDGIVYSNGAEGKGEDSYIILDPKQVKSATGNRGTFDPNDPNILRKGPTEDIGAEPRYLGGKFYSQLYRTLVQKMPGRASVAQIRKIVENPQSGVKAEEIKWSGLDDFLKDRPDASRREVIDFLKANQLQIAEKGIGEGGNQQKINAAQSSVAWLRAQHDLRLEINDEQPDMIAFRDPETEDFLTSEEIGRYFGAEAEQHARTVEDAYATRGEAAATPLNAQQAFEASRTDPVTGALIHELEDRFDLHFETHADNPAMARFVDGQNHVLGAADITRAEGFSAREEALARRIADQHAQNVAHAPVQQANTRFAQYTVPGKAENYREILFTLPPKENKSELGPRGWAEANNANSRIGDVNFQSSHWQDTPNVLAHTRVDDRTTADGKRALFINEVQSDWHQRGRKQGYQIPQAEMPEGERTVAEIQAKIGKLGDKVSRLNRDYTPEESAESDRLYSLLGTLQGTNLRVPPAPFQKNWHEFVMRRMLAEAVEKGHDYLAWVTGDQANDLYDLSKQIDSLRYEKNALGNYDLRIFKNGSDVPTPAGRKPPENLTPQELEDWVGKEIAQKIVDDAGHTEWKVGEVKDSLEHFWQAIDPSGKAAGAYDTKAEAEARVQRGNRNLSPGGTLSGLDLKVGGEGMKGFYDKIMPDYMRRLVKKWGGKVENVALGVKPLTADEEADQAREEIAAQRSLLEDMVAEGNQHARIAAGQLLEDMTRTPNMNLQEALRRRHDEIHAGTRDWIASEWQERAPSELKPGASEPMDDNAAKRALQRVANAAIEVDDHDLLDVAAEVMRRMEKGKTYEVAIRPIGGQDVAAFSKLHGQVGMAFAEESKQQRVHAVRITPEMRESLLADGQPLFKRKAGERDKEYENRTRTALERIREVARARGQEIKEPARRTETPATTAKAGPATRPSVEPSAAARRGIETPSTALPPPTRHVPGERSFPKTAEKSGFTGGTDRDYSVITDKSALEAAETRIARIGVGRAQADLLRTEEPTKHDGAMGILLIQKFEKMGDLKRAVEVANELSRKYTQAGQFVQSASIITHLSPEGVLMAAQRRMKGGRELPEETAKTVVAQAKEVTDAERLVAKIQAARPDIFGPNGEILPAVTRRNEKRDSGARPVTRKRAVERIGKLQDRLATLESDARARLEARRAGGVSQGPKGEAGATSILPDIADWAIIGAAKLARKGIDHATWVAEMARETRAGRKELRRLYRESYKLYEGERVKFLRESRARGAQREVPGPQRPEDRQRIINERLDAMTAARKARTDLARTFRDLNATGTTKVIRTARDVWDLSRSLITSVDLSAGGRQAKTALVSHPQTFARGFLRQFKALSSKQFDRMVSEQQADPDHKYAMRFKLNLTSEATTRGEHEEVYQSELAHHLPWVKHSEQAYNTMLDTVRFGWFKTQIAEMRKNGLDPENPDHKPMFEAQAALINNFTGRGGGKRLQQAAPLLNSAAFSARFWASRLRVLTLPLDPRMYGVGTAENPAFSKATRVDAWKTLLGFYALTASTLAIAKYSGAQVNLTNPDDPDWLKARWGKVHVDFSAGLQSHLRVAARLTKLMYLREFRPGRQRMGPTDIIGHYLRSKEAPNPALIHDLWFSDKKKTPTGMRGTNVIGEPVYLTGEPGKGRLNRVRTSALAQRAIPIVLQDVMDAYQEGLSGKQAAASISASILGEGVTTYQPKGKRGMPPPQRQLQVSP